MANFELIGEVVGGSILFAISGISIYILNYFRRKKEAIASNEDDIEKLELEIIRIRRLLLMIAKRMDRGNRKLHPDVDSDFEDLVKDLLRLRYHALWAYTALVGLFVALDKIPIDDLTSLAAILTPVAFVITADVIKNRNVTAS